MDSGSWIARTDEEFELRIAQEKASARDLCQALRWHRASIAETLPVVDEDGDAERMAEVRRVIAALGRAREELAVYYRLPPADATDDDPYARGEPPRIHARDELRRGLDDSIRLAGGQAQGQAQAQGQRQRAMQHLIALLDSDEAPRLPPRRRAGVIALVRARAAIVGRPR